MTAMRAKTWMNAWLVSASETAMRLTLRAAAFGVTYWLTRIDVGKLAPTPEPVVTPDPKRQPWAYLSYGSKLYEVVEDEKGQKLWVINVLTEERAWLTATEVDWCRLVRAAPMVPDECPEPEQEKV